jgi:hypothetical protein
MTDAAIRHNAGIILRRHYPEGYVGASNSSERLLDMLADAVALGRKLEAEERHGTTEATLECDFPLKGHLFGKDGKIVEECKTTAPEPQSWRERSPLL